MPSDNDIVLDIRDLRVYYETNEATFRAVNGVDMLLRKGKTLGLVGETGAGKTTTVLSILRLVASPPGVIKSGSITLDSHDIFNLSEREMDKIRGKEVSMIFQDPMTSLNPVLTVGEQIAEVIAVHQEVTRMQAIEKAREMLENVGIPGNRADEYPHQFSGGMRQRVMIAIALACNPQLLIADEPTTALDVTIQAQVLELMKSLRTTYGTSMIMITHDLGIVADICDEVSIMYAGKIVEHGTLEDIFEHARHPYTEGLFNSLPNLKDRKAKLKPIKGLMADPSNLPKGCAFHPRCEYACEMCFEKEPLRRAVSDTHAICCHAYDRPGFSLTRGVNHD